MDELGNIFLTWVSLEETEMRDVIEKYFGCVQCSKGNFYIWVLSFCLKLELLFKWKLYIWFSIFTGVDHSKT